MAERAGPNMKRVKLPDGTEMILPEDVTFLERPPEGATDDELREWLEREMKKPLSGTY